MTSVSQKRGSGFRQTGQLLETRIRKAGESRGFAVARLLTHWDEIAGPDISPHCRPVTVGYARKGFGATLTLLTTGAFAPLLQTHLPRLRDRVNACYGYNAISRIRITQTAPDGFSETQSPYTQGKARVTPPEACRHRAAAETEQIRNPELRDALSRLGANILSKTPS